MEDQILLKLNYSKGGRIIWTEDQLHYAVKRYYETYSTPTIAKEFNTSPYCIRRILRQQGVKLLSSTEIPRLRYPKNSDFFEIIDTPQKAYWLGFLYADGNITKNEIYLGLQISDEEHIKKFQKAIGAINNKICYPITCRNGKEYPQARISFRDKKMVEDLIDKGCTPNKTYTLTFPYNKLPENLYSHFIRGIMDGDGDIGWHNFTTKKTFHVGFCGTKDLLDGIKHILKKDKSKMDDRGKAFYFSIDGNKQLIDILDYIYKDSYNEIELARKRKKYDEFLKMMENK